MDTKLSPQIRDRLGSALNSLQQLARYGLANTEYRAGHYDKVLALTGDAVKAVKAQAKGDGPITLKDYKVTGGLLALDLRAKVQTGKVSQAKDLLPLLRRLRGENELENDTAAVLRSLVQDLRVQVKALKEKGDEAQLKTTVEHFSAFLEELARQADPKGMQRDIFFLASCYSSLGKHDKAAALYGQIPEPQRAEGMKPEEREIATYWFMQLQRARELRLAKEFPEARAVLAKIPPRYRSLTVEQEDIYQLEDQHIYGTALTRWNALLDNRTLLRKSATDNEAKKLYFDCYYHFVLCCFEYGKNHKVPAKQTEFIRRAADNIVRLETAANQEGWQLIGTRLQQLVQVEPLLRAQYDQLKKTNRK